MSRYINTELDLDLDSDSELDDKLFAKFKSDSD